MRVNQRVREGQKLINERQQQFMNRPESNVSTQINGRLITFGLPTKGISAHQSKRNSVPRFDVAKSESKLRMQNYLDRDDRRQPAQYSRDYDAGPRSSKHLDPPRLSEVSPADFPNLNKKLLSNALKVHDYTNRYNYETGNINLKTFASQKPNHTMDIIHTHNSLRPAIARTISRLTSARQDKFQRDSPYGSNSRKESSPDLEPPDMQHSTRSSRIPKTTRKPVGRTSPYGGYSEKNFTSTHRNYNHSTRTEKFYSEHNNIMVRDERLNTLSSKGKIFPFKINYRK
jgi:hypothetical protein